jgi:alkanesulfonate monooxygenase SsuD/methylene tetrahydromethanopterin reductase-like flavin-dependent oxidoreductase (luciferase family)
MKIGFILPLGELPEIGRPPSYQEIHDLALQSEQSGLDSIWVYDHLLYRFPERETMGVWECWSMLSALAQATDRVEIGTLVMPVSWRNPALSPYPRPWYRLPPPGVRCLWVSLRSSGGPV